MRDIGSYIDLELCYGNEFHNDIKYGKGNILRLNNCRNAIVHAAKCYNIKKVWVPIYECDTVRNTLLKHGFEVLYYRIDRTFKPLISCNDIDSGIVFPNYYGVFSSEYFERLANRYNNVIIDNAQAFFCKPCDGCINVYSARKFNGVPDGSYVIGHNVVRHSSLYKKDYSSDTSLFLLLRIEYDCAGKAYEYRKINEERINNSEILLMSDLTYRILDSLEYENNIVKRRQNFAYARSLFDGINELHIESFYADDCVPMVYPLLVNNEEIINYFHSHHVYQGHWWEYIVNETDESFFENYLSRYIIPITIDQRYGYKDIEYQYELIMEVLKNDYHDSPT